MVGQVVCRLPSHKSLMTLQKHCHHQIFTHPQWRMFCLSLSPMVNIFQLFDVSALVENVQKSFAINHIEFFL